jgi:adenylate cyclase
MTVSDRRRLFTVLVVALLGGVVGVFYYYILAETGESERGFSDLRLSAMTGFTVAGFLAVFELLWYGTPRGRWLRRRPLVLAFTIRVLILTALSVLALVVNREIHIALGDSDPEKFTEYRLLRDVVFSLSVTVVFIFVLQTRVLIGGRTLRNFLLGRYYRPVEEQRIFLFIDMKGSTDLARRLDNERFHEMLSDVFFAIDTCFVDNGGEVVSYVGDCVITTWPMGRPEDNARVLLAVRDVFARLEADRRRFEKTYGVMPEFRAVANGGAVVVGECGDSKRQITYIGDILNVTARLEEVAKIRDIGFAVAGPLFKRIECPNGFVATSLGALTLRGVAEPMEVYWIEMV